MVALISTTRPQQLQRQCHWRRLLTSRLGSAGSGRYKLNKLEVTTNCLWLGGASSGQFARGDLPESGERSVWWTFVVVAMIVVVVVVVVVEAH